MYDLYTWATPNGWKANILLEELDVPYTVKPVDIGSGIQKSAEYLAINPNGRIPALVDNEADGFSVFESGAILLYLAEKHGRFMPSDTKGRSKVIQWVMFQMGGVGPMQGQAHVFIRYFPDKIPPAIERYRNEVLRLYGVLETQLKAHEFLAGDYSIADMAHWSWVRIASWAKVDINDFPNIKRWLDAIEARPAAQKAIQIPIFLDYSDKGGDEDEDTVAAGSSMVST